MHRAPTPRFALVLAAALWATRAAGAAPAAKAAAPQEKRPEVLVEARPPPFSEGIFPCMECHKDQHDRTRRELQFHDEQQAVLAHGPGRWCLDCHDLDNRNMLRLASGELVPFTESYRLCGQCHGDKLRDWKVGVHGKRVGRWDAGKTYFLCVNCHNPHTPRFKGVTEVVAEGKKTVAPTLQFLKPEPRPVRPEEQRR